MIDTTTFDEILTFVEDQVGIPACIAGGAVRDALLHREPKDYDVFLLVKEPALPYKLEGLPWANEELLPPSIDNGLHLGSYTWYDGIPLELVIGDALTPDELLDRFDWNVTQFAYTLKDGLLQRCPIKTPGTLSDVPLELVNRDKEPLATLRRGFRFQERYGMEFDASDLEFLLEQALVQIKPMKRRAKV